MRFATVIVMAATVLIALAHQTGAQQGDPGIRQNCAGDYFRLCSYANPFSRTDVERCFDARRGELSPACQGAIHDFNRRQSLEQRRYRRL